MKKTMSEFEARMLWKKNFPKLYTLTQTNPDKMTEKLSHQIAYADGHFNGFVSALKITGQTEVRA